MLDDNKNNTTKYKLPNGFYTYDILEFTDKWAEFIIKLEQLVGVRVINFDCSAVNINSGANYAVIPIWLVKKLLEMEDEINGDISE